MISVFEIFTVGIGPSSSHTVGPMRAARRFVSALADTGALRHTRGIRIELFGSLGLTGLGHGTHRAVMLGLEGAQPETVDPAYLRARSQAIRTEGSLQLLGGHRIPFAVRDQMVFHRRARLDGHPNGIVFVATDDSGCETLTRRYLSIGGGFVVEPDAPDDADGDSTTAPHPFATGADLLAVCEAQGASIADIMFANEEVRRPRAEVACALLDLWRVMQDSIATGIVSPGVLPGGLKVRRRAPTLHQRLAERQGRREPLAAMEWVNLWALAVNEENAAGGRVVTAPTNGAAGIIPAVLKYAETYEGAGPDEVVRFLLTAGAVGQLFKEMASISGADVGCQGEIGSACSMAAAGLAALLDGTPQQVEHAAEIGMEHNLGLTCDPVGGLVQVPCIERNAIASMKAINAAHMALSGQGDHVVTLDMVIKTMRQTGADMNDKYKETARGGLAINVVEC